MPSTSSIRAAPSRSPGGRPTSAAFPTLPAVSRSSTWRTLPKLLLEIGCEELPASACREAEAQLPELCRRELGKDPSQLFIGPRRLAFIVDDLHERSPDEWIQGPPEHLRERAAAGFARRHGVG